jgi:hypothetical protein
MWFYGYGYLFNQEKEFKMTETGRLLSIKKRSVGSISPPKNWNLK